MKALPFARAWASSEGEKLPVSAAIDGKEDDAAKGWALGKALGQRQVAAFALTSPVAQTGKSKLTLRLSQKSNDTIGRFRVYLTTASDPLHEGVPNTVAEAAAKPSVDRTEDERKALAEFVQTVDSEFWRLHRELAEAKVPLAPDPAHTGLKETLAKATEPIRLDPVLVQLRLDAAASKNQVANKRLTVIQDLAWALINNPAFLFNR